MSAAKKPESAAAIAHGDEGDVVIMSAAIDRIRDHVARFFEPRQEVWAGVPVQSLMETGAMLALHALGDSLLQDDMVRTRRGERARSVEAARRIREELIAISKASDERSASLRARSNQSENT